MTDMPTNMEIECTGTRVPTGVILPGGCILDLDHFGLPAGPHIRHSSLQICLCHDQEHEIYVKYLIMWQAKFSEQLGIDKMDATAMAALLIEKWELKVPKWLEPVIKQWLELLKNKSNN